MLREPDAPALHQHPDGVVPIQIVLAVPLIGGGGQMLQLRSLTTEQFKGPAVTGEQCRYQLQLSIMTAQERSSSST